MAEVEDYSVPVTSCPTAEYVGLESIQLFVATQTAVIPVSGPVFEGYA